MKAGTSIAAFLVLASPALAAAQNATPIDTVRKVMTLELWALSSASLDAEINPFGEASLAENFTPEFADAYNAVIQRMEERNEPLIDGDLILNSQEYCPLKELALEERPQDAGRAEVAVSFKSSWCYPEAGEEIASRVTEAVFTLVERDGRWLIDDFSVDGSTRVQLEALMDE
jgi:hypothetical protein